MDTKAFKSNIPNGEWDYYYLMQLIISTNITSGGQSIYAEFFPCKYNEEGVVTIKTDSFGNEVKSFFIGEGTFDNGTDEQAQSNQQAIDYLKGSIIDILDSFGKQKGLFL